MTRIPKTLYYKIRPMNNSTKHGVFSPALIHYLGKVIDRRLRMERERYYVSYTVIVVAKAGNKLDINDFVNYKLLDDIRCFPPQQEGDF